MSSVDNNANMTQVKEIYGLLFGPSIYFMLVNAQNGWQGLQGALTLEYLFAPKTFAKKKYLLA